MSRLFLRVRGTCVPTTGVDRHGKPHRQGSARLQRQQAGPWHADGSQIDGIAYVRGGFYAQIAARIAVQDQVGQRAASLQGQSGA